MVEQIARGVQRHLPPAFDLDDLVGEGSLALARAALRYRPREHGGAPFSAFARQAVRGAMIESVRRNKYVEATRPGLEVVELKARTQETPQDERAEKALLRDRLAEAISWLPLGERRVLEIYYSAPEPTLAVVGSKLRISRHAAGALHASAIASLRERFKAS